MSEGPLPAWRARVRAGALSPDSGQERAAEKLQELRGALTGERRGPGRAGLRDRLGLGAPRAAPRQGVYLFGGVGRGKTMLMDLFFDSVPLAAKRRTHFHPFMLEIHDRLHALRGGRERDPLRRVAREVAARARLLCFDELQAENVADAMILGRLFEGLFAGGAVVVATGNTPLSELYKDGLQRDRFLPFIELMTRRLDLLALDGPVDYRRRKIAGLRLYHTPLGPAAERALEAAFRSLIDGAEPRSARLEVLGRPLRVPRAARGVAAFTFGELCGRPLGAPDYLTLARTFHTLVVADVPRLAAGRADEARRFVTLVDALYDRRVKLVLSAEAPPEALCAAGGRASAAFARAASRLHEMQSADYLAALHPGGAEDVRGAGAGLARMPETR